MLGVAIMDIYVDEGSRKLSIIDRARRHHLVDLRTMRITKATNIYKPAKEPFDYYQRSVKLVDTKKVFFWPKDSNYGYIVKTDPFIHYEYRFNHHKSPVTKIGLAHNDSLALSGDERGHTYVINLKHGGIEKRLPAMPDSINASVFSPDDKMISLASFNGNIATYLYLSLECKSRLSLGGIIEDITYLGENLLLVLLRSGKILKVDVNEGRIIEEKELCSGLWPAVLHLVENNKFILVGTRESKLVVLHATSMDEVFTVDFEVGGITTISKSSQFLFLGFTGGELVAINYLEHENKFLEAVSSGKVNIASSYFKENIFLMIHSGTREIYENWLVAKKEITLLLSEGELKRAQDVAQPFMFHPKIRIEMRELEGIQRELAALMRFIKIKDFPKAYALVQSTPELKESEHYKKLEEIWEKIFATSQRLLARDPQLNKRPAVAALKLFLGVPEKKEQVEIMFNNRYLFKKQEDLVKAKNFKEYYLLVEKYDFLKKSPLYKKIIYLQEEIKQKLEKTLSNQDLIESIKVAEFLEQFEPSKEYAKNKLNQIKQILRLEQLLKEDRFNEACVNVSRLGGWNLEYVQIQFFQQEKLKFIKKAKQAIDEGNFKKAYIQVASLWDNEEASEIKREIIHYLYEQEIKKFLLSKDRAKIDWSLSLGNYMNFFGISKSLDYAISKAGVRIPEKYHQIEDETEKYPSSTIFYLLKNH